MGIVHSYHLIRGKNLVLISKRMPFYLLSDIKGSCWWTDLLLRLKMTRAIHHVLKCSTAPREVGMLPASLKARDAGLQLLRCPGFGAAEVPPACLVYLAENGNVPPTQLNSTRLLIPYPSVQSAFTEYIYLTLSSEAFWILFCQCFSNAVLPNKAKSRFHQWILMEVGVYRLEMLSVFKRWVPAAALPQLLVIYRVSWRTVE